MREGHRSRTRRAAGLTLAALAAAAPMGLADLAPGEPWALAVGLLGGLATLVALRARGNALGPRHVLDAALPLAGLAFLVLACFDPLALPDRVRWVTHPLAGAAGAVAVWGLHHLPGVTRGAWAAGALAGLVAGGLAAWAGFGSVVLLAPATILLSAWWAIREVPDPVRPGDDPLDSYFPWASVPARRAWPGLPEALLRAPATLGYLAVGWSVFLAWGEQTRDGFGLDQRAVEPFLYEIPDLTRAPLEAALSLATAPFLNHDLVQFVYVTALLALFGLAVEVREGTGRAAAVFLASGLAGAIAAGVLLHALVAALPDVAFFEEAWRRTWSGGSAGAFGLMGALASRARASWPLLGFFVFWEANVGWFYLQSYTPAFHLTALAVGFWIGRRWTPPDA
ncbi:hypothetical protein BRD56_08375 [Thermoplasmatales archaeon SW_10_69_26]|nr:MAG: hypothetical protein BRD56_08375 [Thermoplasmatales archaeon SW_10_69_26]